MVMRDCMDDFDNMTVDVFLNKNSEYYNKYLEYNRECIQKKAELTLMTDWNKVNMEREEQGLPKITNQSMRDNYVHLDELYCKLQEARDYYDVMWKYTNNVIKCYLKIDKEDIE